MKKMLKAFATLSALAMLFGFGACSSGSSGGSGEDDKPDNGVSNDPSGIDVPEVSFEGAFSPANGATAAYEDGVLMIKFDAAPTVARNAEKTVKIYNEAGTLVDTIKPVDEEVESNAASASYKTVKVKDQLISVNKNVVVIKPHNKKLANGITYYVNVDAGLLTGKVGGANFAGISDATTWKFTTRTEPSITDGTITVGADKNFSTVQGALDYLQTEKSGAWTVEIDEGFYHEFLSFSNKNVNLTMIGNQEGFDARSGDDGKVVIYWANANLWNPSSRQRMAFLYEGGDLTIKNLTIANNISRSDIGKDSTQAEALYYDATGKIVAYNASFKSHQDTLLIGNNGGRGWFYQCYIEGDTDFIWGYPHTVLFEECQIRCLYDSAPAVTNHTSYIFASRSVETAANNKGLVLFNSNIKVDNGVKAYYGRNSGSDTQAAVVFNTFSGIEKELWYEGALAGKYEQDIEGVCTVGYKDFGNKLEDGSDISTVARKEGTYGLSEVVANREYCGRNAILNRGWSKAQQKYVAVADKWDLSAFEEEFNATEDKSKNMIYLEPTYIPYLEGGASTEAFVAKDYAGNTVEATFTSGNSELATVEGAVVTAVEGKDGEVTITATAGEKQGIARVVIVKQFIAATALTMDKTEKVTIEKDDTCTLSVTFAPADATDQAVIWESDDTNVLRVVGDGPTHEGLSAKVTGFGVGTAKIIAKSKKTPGVKAEIEIEVKDVYAATYFTDQTTYTANASVLHRDATIVASPVSFGFAGDLAVAPFDTATSWGNGGWKFAPALVNNAKPNVTAGDGEDFAWADFQIRAAGAIALKTVSADLYCSATSNERAKVYVKVGSGDFVEKGDPVAADSKAMKFTKRDIATEVAAGETVTVRLAIANLEGKTINKFLEGVIGNVSIYYEPKGEPVAFPGADGTYNIIDYHTGATTQNTAVADGTTADGMVSWSGLKYHSTGYGLYVSGSGAKGIINIKVGGPSVISIVGSEYGNGTLTVTDSSETVIAGPVSTKMESDKDIAKHTLSFLYTGDEDTITLTMTPTTYIGTITVKELTTEKAEVKSVKINGAETVSTAAPVTFTAEVVTTYCAAKTVTWTSSDDTIATVDTDGKVTGHKAGTVKITATSTVDETVKAEVSVEITEEELNPVAGETYTYDFKGGTTVFTDKTAGTSADTFVSWNEGWQHQSYGMQNTGSSSTISIKVAGDVVVGFTGYNAASGVMKVTAEDDSVVVANMPMKTGSDATTKWFIYKGEATTLTLTNLSGATYISTLTVKPWTDEVPAVKSVTISGNESIFTGNSANMVAIVDVDYFADTTVTWSSSLPSVATVTDAGKVEALTPGTTVITATSVFDSTKAGTITVTVSDKPSFVATNTYVFQNDGNTSSNYTTVAAKEDSSKEITFTGIKGHGYGAVTTGSEHSVTIPATGPMAITVYVNYPGAVSMKLYDAADTSAEPVVLDSVTDNNTINSQNTCPETGFTVVYKGGTAENLKLVIDGTVYMYQIQVTNFQNYQYVFQNDGNTSSNYTTVAAKEDSSKEITLTGIKGHSYGAVTTGNDHYVTIPATGPMAITVYVNYPGDVALKLYDAADTSETPVELDKVSGNNAANSSGSCPETGFAVAYKGGTAENLKLVLEGTVYMYQINVAQ